MKPMMLRRTKDQVASDLPPKQEQALTLDLGAKHRKLYDTRLARERQKVLGLLGDFERNRFEIFRSLTMLRQLSLHAGLVDEADRGSGRRRSITLPSNCPGWLRRATAHWFSASSPGFSPLLRRDWMPPESGTATWTARCRRNSAPARSAGSPGERHRCS